MDDRVLYWQRLAYLKSMRESGAIAEALMVFEEASRGLSDLDFADADMRILVTGFDPFHLDIHIDQGNPSGLAAQWLNGRTIDVAGASARIQTLQVPVRYRDFDAGWIESVFRTAVLDQQVDLIITVSMGRTGFDLERFPGRRRSSGMPDNDNHLCGDSTKQPLVPAELEGPEFVEFSLPVSEMLRVEGNWSVQDNRTVCTVERGEFDAESLSVLNDQTAVQGSGGGYLSNEISYRLLNLLQQMNVSLPAGHIHTPKVAGFDAEKMKDIVFQVERLTRAAILALMPR
jgi:pyrrolidone-carboxylate peptidase